MVQELGHSLEDSEPGTSGNMVGNVGTLDCSGSLLEKIWKTENLELQVI